MSCLALPQTILLRNYSVFVVIHLCFQYSVLLSYRTSSIPQLLTIVALLAHWCHARYRHCGGGRCAYNHPRWLTHSPSQPLGNGYVHRTKKLFTFEPDTPEVTQKMFADEEREFKLNDT